MRFVKGLVNYLKYVLNKHDGMEVSVVETDVETGVEISIETGIKSVFFFFFFLMVVVANVWIWLLCGS